MVLLAILTAGGGFEMGTGHWVVGLLLLLLAFMAGTWYAKGTLKLP